MFVKIRWNALLAAVTSTLLVSTLAFGEVTISDPRDFTVVDQAALGTLQEGYGLAPGQPAPDAELLTIEGTPQMLSSLWQEQNLLVVFYRGGWCPYCNAQIRELTVNYAEFESRSVLPVLISVDTPDAASLLDAAYEIPFVVMSDGSLNALESYNVVLDMSAAVERMKTRGLDLEAYSGQDHHKIAVASSFLIAQGGQLIWSHADPEFQTRPSAAQLLQVIDEKL